MASSTGIHRETGKVLEDWEHTKQSLLDIFTTPLGTRVMRRDYGSEVPDLIDAPMSYATIADYAYALGDGTDKWEPRFSLERMWVNRADSQGVFEPAMDGIEYPLGHLGDFSVKHTISGVRNSDEDAP